MNHKKTAFATPRARENSPLTGDSYRDRHPIENLFARLEYSRHIVTSAKNSTAYRMIGYARLHPCLAQTRGGFPQTAPKPTRRH